jgi:hypothetical protein
VAFGPAASSYIIYDHSGRLTDWYSNGEFALYMRGPTQIKASHSQSYEYFGGVALHEDADSISFFSGWRKWVNISAGYTRGASPNYSPPRGTAPFVAHSNSGYMGLTLRSSNRLRFDQTYYYTRLGSPVTPLPSQSTGTTFNNHISRTKLNFQFTRAVSFRAILDYYAVLPNSSLINQDFTKVLTGDLLMTWLVNPFTALYVGYTDRYENRQIDRTNPSRLVLIPAPSGSTGRQVFAKFSYLYRF